MDTAGKPTLMLIDGHSLAFRAFYALPLESFQTPDGQHTNAIHGFLSMMLSLIRQENPSHLAVAFDISRFSFRTREYPDYKATRGETPSEFVGQVPLLQEALHAMSITTITKEDFEADDIIATLARRGQEAGYRVLVVSGDRDTIQLVNEQVTLLYPSSRGVAELKRYTPESVLERYGVPPEKYPDVAALVGETSDNLTGIDKVGEKTAVKWLNQYESLENLLAHAEDINGVVGNNLREQRERAERNRRLNHLITDVELPVELDDLERVSINPDAVREVFGKLRFRTLTERVLALAEEGQTASSPPRDSTDAPVAQDLLDEELSHWLDAASGPIAISVQTGANGLVIGLAQGSAAVRVIDTPGSDDSKPLRHALIDPRREWWWRSAKSELHLLARAGWETPAVVHGDLRLASWLEQPGRKLPELQDVVYEHLGETIQPVDSDTLALDDDPAVSAWWLWRVYPVLRDSLPDGQRLILHDIELPLVPILWQMETRGIGSDTTLLSNLHEELAAEAEGFQAEAFEAIGHEVNLASPKQLQTVLFDELGMPKTRQTKTGYSTDQQALSDLQLTNPHPFLTALLGFRDQSKLLQIVDGLEKAVGSDNRLHTTFDQTGTSTGRLSSLDPNLQNIPARTSVGHDIRRSFVAQPPHEALLTADYSQIEMRIMAHFSGDAQLIEAFRRGEDLHSYVGAQVFDVAEDEVTPEMRTKVKAMSYGLAYGLSAYGLAKQLRIEPSEAKNLMAQYFERFGRVRDYLRDVVEQARTTGYTETLFGRRRPFPELKSPNRMLREAAERAALNAPMQGTAADIIKRAMIALDTALARDNLESRLVLQVHDELVYEVAHGERESLETLVRQEMVNAASLDVPLEVNVGYGENWDDAAH